MREGAMPVIRTRFCREYAQLMQVWDKVTEPERNIVKASVEALFSTWSDATDIKNARRTLQNIVAKYQ
jgi:hypothetical protein